MDVREIRAANLSQIADKEGGHAALARRLGVSRPTISKRIGRTPSAYIGHNMARDIEKAYGLAPFYLDSPHANPGDTQEPEIIARRVPVLALFDTREYIEDPAAFDPEHVITRLHSPVEHTASAFAVQCDDDAMTPDIHRGDYLFIEPLLSPKAGQIALIEVNGEYGIRELATNFGQWLGRPLNPAFPSINIDPEHNLIGICIAQARHINFS